VSLERIKAHILEQAKNEADRIVKTAREGLELRLSRARVSLKEEMERRLVALDQKLQEENAQALSELQARNQMRLLELKNQLIGDLFQRTLKHLLSLSTQEYLALLEGWLNRLEPKERAYLRLSPEDTARIGEELVKRVNSARKMDLLLLDPNPVPIKGGFILKTKKYEIDHSLETFIRHLKEELTPELAKELFGA
jgi:V/A-type H+-transporting ATPase subunit E